MDVMDVDVEKRGTKTTSKQGRALTNLAKGVGHGFLAILCAAAIVVLRSGRLSRDRILCGCPGLLLHWRGCALSVRMSVSR